MARTTAETLRHFHLSIDSLLSSVQARGRVEKYIYSEYCTGYLGGCIWYLLLLEYMCVRGQTRAILLGFASAGALVRKRANYRLGR